jgi:hypothetical protein
MILALIPTTGRSIVSFVDTTSPSPAGDAVRKTGEEICRIPNHA